jgi:lysophospholipase L1-like esterase
MVCQSKLRGEKEKWVGRRGLKLLLLGDSITEHLTGASVGAVSQRFDEVKAEFDSSFEKDSTLALGIAGDQTQHLLWRLGEGGELEGLEPEFVHILIGTNNLGAGFTPEDTFEGIKAVVDLVRGGVPASTRIILQEIFPREFRNPGKKQQIKVAEVNEMMREQWKQEVGTGGGGGVTLAQCGRDFVTDETLGLDERDWKVKVPLMPDHLHPSASGVKLWMDCLKAQMVNTS